MLVQKTRKTSKMAQIALADWFIKIFLMVRLRSPQACVIFDKNLFDSGLSKLGFT